MLTVPCDYDVLGAVLDGNFDFEDPKIEMLNALIDSVSECQSQKNSNSVRRKTIRLRKKSTHYLEFDIFEELGKAKDLIRKLHPELSKAAVSKTTIVNHALQLILEDFTEKQNNSTLMKNLIDTAESL